MEISKVLGCTIAYHACRHLRMQQMKMCRSLSTHEIQTPIALKGHAGFEKCAVPAAPCPSADALNSSCAELSTNSILDALVHCTKELHVRLPCCRIVLHKLCLELSHLHTAGRDIMGWEPAPLVCNQQCCSPLENAHELLWVLATCPAPAAPSR